ncbi:DUF6519 domain-containing protein [Streptomyces sioyaensis]|uniref:DUF6519 domain-containing protein n=1 Tax=Streptomyces sioyaensis TaxID=67364 RepID=UPI00379706DC
MSGDYARMTFDRLDDFNRLWVQQGRVLLQADLNELADALDHRLRALGLDVLGPCTAPIDLEAGTPPEATGFEIAEGGASFTIGLGRLYVHGLELDNHGGLPRHVEPGLQDLRGAEPVPYEAQPYYPDPPAMPAGRHVVYIDAWEREVTAVEDPRLTDPGVGVDTAARVQTVWQVKVLPDDATSVSCWTPDDQVPGWLGATAPSAARLTTEAVVVPADTDPCAVPPDGGYRGWENRLYRVEVHDGGAIGEATFKWSRDNASVATAVLGVDSTRTVLTVARTGRDDVQRIREGAWVEVLDDPRELSGRPGFMAKVLTVDGVDEATQTVTLSAQLPADIDPATAIRRTRLRQWDQRGPAAGADGTLRVSGALTGFVLEDGVQITFAADPAVGALHTGDHWSFAARSADGSVQRLSAAPPQGTKHFYGRLAVVDLPGEVTDCRTVWRPLDDCGDCTVCVTPESHASGLLTIQMAVDQLAASGGRVCLKGGRYELDEPVVVRDARSLTISGHGGNTVVDHPGSGPALVVSDCDEVTVRDLSLVAGVVHAEPTDTGAGARNADPGSPADAATTGIDAVCTPTVVVGIAVVGSFDVEILRCSVTAAHRYHDPTALGPVAQGAPPARRAGPAAPGTCDHKAVGRPRGGPARTIPTTRRGGTSQPPDRGSVAGQAGRSQQALGGLRCETVVGVAITPLGVVDGLAVRECVLRADFGIAPLYLMEPSDENPDTVGLTTGLDSDDLDIGYVALHDFALDDSVVIATETGVWLDERAITASGTRIRGSLIWGAHQPAVRWQAYSIGEPTLTVRDCALLGARAGVELATYGADLSGSWVWGYAAAIGGDDMPENGSGVLLDAPELDEEGAEIRVSDCVIIAEGYGVALRGDQSDVDIRGCRVDGSEGGIVMLPEAVGRRILVRDNDVRSTPWAEARLQPLVTGIWLVQVTDGEVRGNQVHDIAAAEAGNEILVGIAVEECRSVTVLDNTVTGLATQEGPQLTVGIGAWPWHERFDAVGNVIDSGPEPSGDRGLRRDRDEWAIFVSAQDGSDPPAPVPTDRSQVLVQASRALRVRLADGFARVTPWRVSAGPEDAVPATTVQDNRITARGNVTAVVAEVGGPLLFSGNLVRRTVTTDDDISPRPIVLGWSDSLVASANHVASEGVPMELYTAPARAAVTGNVTQGEILISGAPLAEPWHSMNVRL